jgi:hypothetical protein
MSKKLLNEGTIRRFMKLAALKPITDAVISEMAMDSYKRDDEPMEEAAITEDEVVAEEEELELADAEEVEMDAEEEPAEEAPAGDHEDLLRRVVQAVAAELEVDVEIEGDEIEGEGDEELELADEEPPAEEEQGVEMGLADEEAAELPPQEDDLLGEIEAVLQEAGIEVVDEQEINESLVKKVSARVVRRLLKEFA